MVKSMETKLPWTGQSLREKVVSGAVVAAEEASGAEVVAEAAEADLEAEAGEALEGEVASEEAGEEAETTSHKERRRSLNSPSPCLYPFVGKKGLWGFTLLPVDDRAF